MGPALLDELDVKEELIATTETIPYGIDSTFWRRVSQTQAQDVAVPKISSGLGANAGAQVRVAKV